MRSCVMGRGGGDLLELQRDGVGLEDARPRSGSDRLSSSSRRMMIGMFETGSRASPRTFISTNIRPPPVGDASVPAQAVRQRLGDADVDEVTDGRRCPCPSKFTTRLQRVRPDSSPGLFFGTCRPPAPPRCARPAGALRSAPSPGSTDLQQPALRPALTSSATWSGIVGGRRARAPRVAEDEHVVVADALDHRRAWPRSRPRSRPGSRR